jgi:hypothetical protein
MTPLHDHIFNCLDHLKAREVEGHVMPEFAVLTESEHGHAQGGETKLKAVCIAPPCLFPF